MNQTNRSHKTIGLVQVSLLCALIIIMAFTPFLGYIPLGFTRATIIHIPVIIGALLLGPKKGAILGFVFGLTSLLNNTFNPTVTSFVFTPFYSLGDVNGNFGSLVVCFLPRILVGVIPYYVFQLFEKAFNKRTYSLILAGISGALTNTLLVMHFIFFFFKDSYASANGVSSDTLYVFIIGIIGMNGVPEAIVSAVLVLFLGKVLLRKIK